MAQRSYVTTFAVALIAAVGGTFALYRVLDTPGVQRKIVTRPVIFALQDISKGRAIELASVGVARWPFLTVPAGAYTTVDSAIGRVARINIFKGEVILSRHLAPDDTGRPSR
jgi:Flp pilus assembly protein CpaB